MKSNKKYNTGDEVIVQLMKHLFHYAQVVSDDGMFVQLILKENTSKVRTYLYDREYGVTHNMIVEKIYDSETDKCLEMSN
jgi:hypothetical protein